METLKEQEQIKLYLQEALEMLDDMRHNLGLFEKQRYFRFRDKITNHLVDQPRDVPGVIEISLHKQPGD